MSFDYKKITQQFGVSYIFTFLIFIFSPVLTFLLTRTLSVTEYGIFSILSATITVLTTLLVFGLPFFVVTKLSGYKHVQKVKAIISIFVFEFIILVVITAFLFIPWIQNIILYYLKIPGYRFEFQLSLLIMFVGTLFALAASYLAANRKLEIQSFVFFLRTCLWRILLILVFFFFGNFTLKHVFYLWFIGMIITFIVLLMYLKKDIAFFFTKIKSISYGIFKKSIVFSLPLLLFFTSGLVISLADKYMINFFNGPELTGIYSLSYALVSMILSFSGVISGVLYPHLAKAWNEKKEHNILFNAMLKYNLIMVLPAMVGLFVLRNQIITLISGPEYLLAAPAISILIAFPLFAALITILTNNLMLRDKTRMIGYVYTGGAVLNIILNLFLIPKLGINGAAIATISSYLFMYIVFHFATKDQFSWNFKFLRIERMVAASLIIGAVLFFINPIVYSTKITTLILGVAIYTLLVYLFHIFDKQEYAVVRSFLPKFLHRFFR